MRKLLLTCITALISYSLSFAQISISCATGTGPVLPAGWAVGGSASAPGPHVQLNPMAGGQAGQLWFTTPQSLTGCGSFVAEFDYQIITPTATPTPTTAADGMAFWIVNPLTGFVGGGGIGLPTNPNGLVLIFDTYNNDGAPNDPMVSLYGYPAGFTGTYVEGVVTNRLGFVANYGPLYDNGWHHAKVTYSGGNVKVYLDYSATPNMSGFFPITTPGYFGFCASTGAVTSIHNVRNVYITANTISPIVGPTTLCVGSNTTYTDSTAGGTWTSTNTAVGTINASTGVFTPLTAGTTSISYAYSSTCNTGITVTVHPGPLSAITGPTPICASSPTTYTNATGGGTWSSSDIIVGPIGGSSGTLTPGSAGVVTISYTLPVGCFTTKAVTINTAPPPLSITPAPATICNNGVLGLTATGASTYNLFPPNGWETGVPTTAGAPVNQWTYTGTATSLWHQLNGAMATTPTISAAYGGTFVAKFNCRSSATGTTAVLYSPSFSMIGVGTATLSFWVYRDLSAFNTAAYNTEGVTVYVNTTATVGGTNLGFVPRRGGLGITGPLTGTSIPGVSGWYQYTVTIPGAFTGATNYIIFSANSNNGNNLYLDDVTLTGTVGPATWASTTWLFNDPAFTIPYTGTALNPVHMHPTGVMIPTTITYTASVTNGTCSSTGTTTVTVNPNPDTISGIRLVCLGATTTLNCFTPGGAWSSLNTTVATVNPATGVVGGAGLGTATIVYAVGSCSVTTVVTVVTSPGTITGPTILCLGSTATYTNPTAGGVWSSFNPAVAPIGASTGIASGDAVGTTVITYGIGSCYSTLAVTVNPVPTPISGSFGLCTGASTTLSSGPAGGFWSSSATSIATVNPLSGLVTAGSTPGTAIISYTRIGCSALATMNVVTTPTPITGTLTTCYGSTTTLAHPTPGGTWSSSNTSIATVSPTGVVTGASVAGGTATITYTVSPGCFATTVVTVAAMPPAPTGTMTVCAGATTTLNHATAGGTWTAPCPGIATIGFSSGVVTSGPGSGSCVVTYTLPVSGCITTATVNVHPVPAGITGTTSVCAGSTATLANATPSGSWSMACPATGTINSSTGAWMGINAGTCIVSYSLSTGCRTTTTVTVDAAPTPITGTFTVCVGSTTALASGPGAGAWSSFNTFVATVSGGGVVTGHNAGTSTISFALPGGCYTTQVVTVIATPNAITGAPGAFALCVGNTTTLNASPTGGTWSSSASGIAPVVTSGISAGTPYVIIGGNAPGGVSTITYTIAGCSSSATVTVNTLPGVIGGTLSTCVNQCTTLTNSTGGGTWMSSNIAVGTIHPTLGTFCGITAGTANITYSLGSGCTVWTTVTVNGLPSITGGPYAVCEGGCINISGSPTPGTWASSNTAVGTIGAGTGTFCGIAFGTTTVTYTRTSTGCYTTTTATVNPLPTAISGITAMCAGTCINLTGTPGGGTWISGNTAVGTINSGSGVFCGLSGGTSPVTYTLPTGCRRIQGVVVDALPTSVTGSTSVCEAQCATLTGSPGGGLWSSGNPSIGTIGSSSGSFCGVAAGTVNITYTLPTTCSLVVVRTVNPLPTPITGLPTMCVGMTTTLNSTPSTGMWTSGNTSVATIDAFTGVATGQSGTFTAVISYSLPSGCRTTIVTTVMGLPSSIGGTLQVCVNGTTTVNCTPAGGTWSMSCPTIGSINSTTGVVTGISAGTCTVTYLMGTGCIRTAVVSVNPAPGPITGTGTMCVGTTTTLTSTPGGTWTSANPSIASVGSATGIVTGNSGPLTTTIIHTNSFNCSASTTVTVYALPANITGVMSVCDGLTTALTSPGTPGGTWASSNTGVATIGSSSGIVTGQHVLVPSTAIITYTLGTGCFKIATVTVNPLPDDITGITSFCQNECIAVTSSTGGGVWSTGTPSILSQSTTTPYIFCGIAPGSGMISYTMPATGCYKTFTTTVQPLPTAIAGPSVVCVNETITQSGSPSGGVWSGGGTHASINASTGVVTGVSAGTDIITYHYPVTGCILTKTITVNALPNPITGIDQVCVGLTTSLSNSSGGGSWASSNAAVGSIDAGGVVTGIIPGTTLISYTFISTGCRITAPVTVNQLPTTILGPAAYCNFSDATYTSTPSGGTWSTSNIAEIEFITPTIGTATAHGTPGLTTTITYTLPTGCIATKDVYLILAPYDIDGPDEVCKGGCITLSNIIAGGAWSNTTPGIITLTPATSSTAVVCGISPGVGNVVYTLSTGCSSSLQVTVNPIPSGITGSPQVCVGLMTNLDNSTPGGNWVSSDGAIATVGSLDGIVTGINGGVSGNTVTITYALGTGCNAQQIVTVNPLPDVITGTFEVCEGLTTTLSSGPATGTWTSADIAVATVGSGSGIVTGVNAFAIGTGGMGQTTITYTLPTGCIQTQNFTVNPLPSPISGITNLCQNDVTVLGNPTPGGTWSSSNPTVASINAFGVVTGNNPGSVVITYMLGTGCISTWPMTVHANPDAITGSLQVCAGFATNLHSGPSGGVWSQDPASMVYGTINSITGVVSGITGGLVPVSYTLGSGCRTTATVTVVNLPPAIGGDARVCEAGGTTLLTHTMTGGIWSSSNPARATVDATSGLVTGITAGTSTITFTIGTGCFNIRHVTVNSLPATITGPYTVCEGSQITLANATPGGTWQSGATAIATIGINSGILNGVAAGQAPVSYILTATGCHRSVNITVNPTPAPITGNPHICIGSAVTYSTTSTGGTWINGNPAVISFVGPVTASTMTVLPVSLGTARITYQFGTGCRTMRQVTVQPLPIVFNVTGGGNYCAGGPGVPVGLDSSQPGVSYELRRGSVAAGYISGTGFPFSFGLQAVAGTYTVQATNVTSGCQRSMAGSATVIINASVTPTVSINVSPTDSVCPGETVNLTASPTSGGTSPTYIWKVNGVTVGSGTAYSFIPSDGDIASVVMTSNGTCITTATATMSRPITVLPVALPVAGIVVSPNDTLCKHTPVTLTAAPEYGGTAPTYSWTLNGAPVGTASSFTYEPNDGDILNYRLTSNYRCRLANVVMSADVKMYVEPILIPHVAIHATPGLNVAAGKPVTLTAVSWDAGPDPTYQWKVNGHPVPGATTNTYTAVFNNNDSIACTIVSSGICHNIGTSDWVFITTTTSTTLQAGGHTAITLLPNPNKGQFTVRGTLTTSGNEDAEIDITNMLGQVVYKGTLQVRQGKVDAQIIMDKTLANGMYILSLRTQEGLQTFHFVMQQ